MTAGAIDGGVARAHSRRQSLARFLAMLVLPASIVPVLLCGPTLLRAPHRLLRQVEAAVQRMEESHHPPAVKPKPSSADAGSGVFGAVLPTATRAGSAVHGRRSAVTRPADARRKDTQRSAKR